MDQATIAEARAVIKNTKAEREEACRADLHVLLEKHNCVLDVRMILTTDRVTPVLNIVAKEV